MIHSLAPRLSAFLGRFPEGFPQGINVLHVDETRAAVVAVLSGLTIFVDEVVDYHPPDAETYGQWRADDIDEDTMPWVTDGTRRYLDVSSGKVFTETVYESDAGIQGVVYALNGEKTPPEIYEQYILGLVKEAVAKLESPAWRQDAGVLTRLHLEQYHSFIPMMDTGDRA